MAPFRDYYDRYVGDPAYPAYDDRVIPTLLPPDPVGNVSRVGEYQDQGLADQAFQEGLQFGQMQAQQELAQRSGSSAPPPPYQGSPDTQRTLWNLLGPVPNARQQMPGPPPPSLESRDLPPPRQPYPFLANAPRQLSDAELYEGMSPAEMDLRRLYGPTAKIGSGDLIRMRTAHGEGLLSALAQQRQMSAYQAQQLQLAREKESWDQAFGVATNKELSYDQRMLGLKDLAKTSPIAARFAQGLTTKLLGDLDAYGQYMPQDEAFYKQGLMSGEFGFDRVAADLDIAKQTSQLITKAKAPMQLMQNLQAIVEKDPQNTAAKDALATLKAEQEEKQASAKIKTAQARTAAPQAQATLQKTQQDAKAAGLEIRTVPIDNQGTMGTMLFDKTTGTGRLLQQGTPIQKQQLMSTSMLKERADLQSQLTALQSVAELFHPDFVGTFDTAKNAIVRMFGGTERTRIDPKTGQPRPIKEEDFRVAYDMLQKILRKELMGTAQSVQELSANPLAFPQASDRDADVTIPAFLKSQYRNIVQRLQSQTDVMDQLRRTNPTSIQQRYRELSDLSRATTKDGKNALGFNTAAEREEAIAQRLAEEIQRGWVIQ